MNGMRFFLFFLCSSFLSAEIKYDFHTCYRLIEQNLFNEVSVKEAMGLHPEIDQGQWNPIVRDLKNRARQVPDLVKKRAANIRPNPFNPPTDPDAAVKLLYDTQYEVFRSVMHDNYVNNDNIIKDMFEYLKESQRIKNKNCFDETSTNSPTNPPTANQRR